MINEFNKKQMGKNKEKKLEEEDDNQTEEIISNAKNLFHDYKGSNPFNYKEKSNT